MSDTLNEIFINTSDTISDTPSERGDMEWLAARKRPSPDQSPPERGDMEWHADCTSFIGDPRVYRHQTYVKIIVMDPNTNEKPRIICYDTVEKFMDLTRKLGGKKIGYLYFVKLVEESSEEPIYISVPEFKHLPNSQFPINTLHHEYVVVHIGDAKKGEQTLPIYQIIPGIHWRSKPQHGSISVKKKFLTEILIKKQMAYNLVQHHTPIPVMLDTFADVMPPLSPENISADTPQVESTYARITTLEGLLTDIREPILGKYKGLIREIFRTMPRSYPLLKILYKINALPFGHANVDIPDDVMNRIVTQPGGIYSAIYTDKLSELEQFAAIIAEQTDLLARHKRAQDRIFSLEEYIEKEKEKGAADDAEHVQNAQADIEKATIIMQSINKNQAIMLKMQTEAKIRQVKQFIVKLNLSIYEEIEQYIDFPFVENFFTLFQQPIYALHKYWHNFLPDIPTELDTIYRDSVYAMAERVKPAYIHRCLIHPEYMSAYMLVNSNSKENPRLKWKLSRDSLSYHVAHADIKKAYSYSIEHVIRLKEVMECTQISVMNQDPELFRIFLNLSLFNINSLPETVEKRKEYIGQFLSAIWQTITNQNAVSPIISVFKHLVGDMDDISDDNDAIYPLLPQIDSENAVSFIPNTFMGYFRPELEIFFSESEQWDVILGARIDPYIAIFEYVGTNKNVVARVDRKFNRDQVKEFIKNSDKATTFYLRTIKECRTYKSAFGAGLTLAEYVIAYCKHDPYPDFTRHLSVDIINKIQLILEDKFKNDSTATFMTAFFDNIRDIQGIPGFKIPDDFPIEKYIDTDTTSMRYRHILYECLQRSWLIHDELEKFAQLAKELEKRKPKISTNPYVANNTFPQSIFPVVTNSTMRFVIQHFDYIPSVTNITDLDPIILYWLIKLKPDSVGHLFENGVNDIGNSDPIYTILHVVFEYPRVSNLADIKRVAINRMQKNGVTSDAADFAWTRYQNILAKDDAFVAEITQRTRQIPRRLTVPIINDHIMNAIVELEDMGVLNTTIYKRVTKLYDPIAVGVPFTSEHADAINKLKDAPVIFIALFAHIIMKGIRLTGGMHISLKAMEIMINGQPIIDWPSVGLNNNQTNELIKAIQRFIKAGKMLEIVPPVLRTMIFYFMHDYGKYPIRKKVYALADMAATTYYEFYDKGRTLLKAIDMDNMELAKYLAGERISTLYYETIKPLTQDQKLQIEKIMEKLGSTTHLFTDTRDREMFGEELHPELYAAPSDNTESINEPLAATESDATYINATTPYANITTIADRFAYLQNLIHASDADFQQYLHQTRDDLEDVANAADSMANTMGDFANDADTENIEDAEREFFRTLPNASDTAELLASVATSINEHIYDDVQSLTRNNAIVHDSVPDSDFT